MFFGAKIVERGTTEVTFQVRDHDFRGPFFQLPMSVGPREQDDGIP